jgi:hypothetical protein
MKLFKYSFLFLFAATLLLVACKDEASNPVPEFGSGLVAVVDRVDAATRPFSFADPAKKPSFKWRWLSFDKKLTCNKVEFFVTFREPYTDTLSNKLTAIHGTKLWKTVEGADVPANYGWKNFEITQAEIYALFKDNTFNYKNKNGTVPVFANPAKSARKATTPLLESDVVRVTWIIYDTNGDKYDSWSFNVCTDQNFPLKDGYVAPVTNCQYDIPVGK